MAATVTLVEQAKIEGWSDEEVVRRVLAGETPLFEILMRRYNQRLYRAALAILGNEAEAEDVLQDAYVRAYQHLRQFAGRAQFSTWLTRIAVHEALARVRRQKRAVSLDEPTPGGDPLMSTFAATEPSPEQQVSQAELGRVLETAILAIPEKYRAVLMLRDVENMSTAEVAGTLGLTEENVKVRLHRARALVRKELYATTGAVAPQVFGFMAERCDRLVKRVFERLQSLRFEVAEAGEPSISG
jgi:RNA polymerase sigma-70 factor (ECF subfamily)